MALETTSSAVGAGVECATAQGFPFLHYQDAKQQVRLGPRPHGIPPCGPDTALWGRCGSATATWHEDAAAVA